MPKREKADHELIFVTYDRLQNAAATARELKLHYNTVTGALRQRGHQCIDCCAKIVGGQRLCRECKERQAERIKRRRAEAARLGRCQSCDEPRDPLSRQFCSKHRIAHLRRNEEHHAREVTKRGTKHPGIPSVERREHYVRTKYGLAGLAVWRAAGGKCALCETPYSEVSLHLHHIACDKTNIEDNLICICFNCHQATHQLLKVANLPAFLTWFHATYPDGQVMPVRKEAA